MTAPARCDYAKSCRRAARYRVEAAGRVWHYCRYHLGWTRLAARVNP